MIVSVVRLPATHSRRFAASPVCTTAYSQPADILCPEVYMPKHNGHVIICGLRCKDRSLFVVRYGSVHGLIVTATEMALE